MDRLGMISAAIEFAGRMPRLLPPEHRIVAERDVGWGLVDYIVAGPFMPEVAHDATPPKIEALMTMHCPPETAPAIRLTAEFYLSVPGPRPPALGEWEVGRWPTMDAYRQEMDAL